MRCRLAITPRQVLRQVDAEGVPPAPAQKRVPGLVHQAGDLGRLGRDRQRARLDSPLLYQVADHAAYVIGLLLDDRKHCVVSVGSSAGEAPSTEAAEPLLALSGVRSS